MSSTDAQITIGADSSELIASMKQAQASVASAVNEMKGSLNSMGQSFEMLKGAFLGISAILAGGKMFHDAIESTEKWNGSVTEISKKMGITAQQASVMNVALTLIGKTSEDLTSASFKLLKQIKANEDGINDMGLKTRDANGNLKPMLDLVTGGVDVLKQYKEGVDRDAAAMYLFGKGAAEVMGLQKLNNELMEKSKEVAEKYNLVIGKEGVEESRKYKMAQAELGLMWTAIQHQLGESLMPTLLGLSEFFATIGPGAIAVFKMVLESIIGIFEGLYQVCNYAALAIAKLLSLMSPEKWDAKIKALEKNIADSNDRIRKMLGKNIKTGEIEPPKKDGTKTFKNFGDKNKKDPSQMGEWETKLAEAKVYYQKENDLREMSKDDEKAYWTNILNTQVKTVQERIAVSKKIANADLEILKKAAKDRKGLTELEINDSEKSALDGLKMEEELNKRKLESGEITAAQSLRVAQDFEARKFEIMQAAQQARIEAQKLDPSQDPVALQAQKDKLLEIERQHALSVEQINTQMAKQAKDDWSKMFEPVTSAISQSINGMIAGTLTLKKAISNLLQSIIAEFVNAGVKMVANWAAQELAKTGLSKAFSAIRAALGMGEEISVREAKIAEGNAVVDVNTAEMATGAAAAVASIPIIGPELAAAAFETMMALGQGSKALFSASGGFDIPAGANPLTQLHSSEMVLPANIANPLRESLAGGGIGGDTHLHVHAVDSQSVERLFRDHGHLLAREMRRQARNFAPTKA
jgi:hypothetical protein